jgi:hypothetical protein
MELLTVFKCFKLSFLYLQNYHNYETLYGFNKGQNNKI